MIDEERIHKTISSDREFLALQSDIGASATSSDLEHQTKHAKEPPGEHSAADTLRNTDDAQRWTATAITQTTSKVRQDETRPRKMGQGKKKVYREYMIDHIVGHVSRGDNT